MLKDKVRARTAFPRRFNRGMKTWLASSAKVSILLKIMFHNDKNVKAILIVAFNGVSSTTMARN